MQLPLEGECTENIRELKPPLDEIYTPSASSRKIPSNEIRNFHTFLHDINIISHL
jgi:hypothetical protein